MKVGVFGLWHLGCVTAACTADVGYQTVGLDFDHALVARLKDGRAPLLEPGLDDLLSKGLKTGTLGFSTDPVVAADCDLVWVTFDTPVDDHDVADVDFVVARIERIFPHLSDGAVVLISSQLPAGSTRRIAEQFAASYPDRTCHFAYSPENLRLGKAIEIFKASERIIVGSGDVRVREVLEPLLERFTTRIIWMSVESAEMVKHGVNAFLAMSVIFANELATICEQVGADAEEVELALRLEPRIGLLAYIRPGSSFAGGTLARDVVFLNTLAAHEHVNVPLFASLLESNEGHRRWPVRRLVDRLGKIGGAKIAILGLAYKPGTDTLRRSSSLALCQELTQRGASVVAYDPAVQALPADARKDDFALASSAETALSGADAVVVATEWPEFRTITPQLCVDVMRSPVILDPNRFLATDFKSDPRVSYLFVGKP